MDTHKGLFRRTITAICLMATVSFCACGNTTQAQKATAAGEEREEYKASDTSKQKQSKDIQEDAASMTDDLITAVYTCEIEGHTVSFTAPDGFEEQEPDEAAYGVTSISYMKLYKGKTRRADTITVTYVSDEYAKLLSTPDPRTAEEYLAQKTEDENVIAKDASISGLSGFYYAYSSNRLGGIATDGFNVFDGDIGYQIYYTSVGQKDLPLPEEPHIREVSIN